MDLLSNDKIERHRWEDICLRIKSSVISVKMLSRRIVIGQFYENWEISTILFFFLFFKDAKLKKYTYMKIFLIKKSHRELVSLASQLSIWGGTNDWNRHLLHPSSLAATCSIDFSWVIDWEASMGAIIQSRVGRSACIRGESKGI